VFFKKHRTADQSAAIWVRCMRRLSLSINSTCALVGSTVGINCNFSKVEPVGGKIFNARSAPLAIGLRRRQRTCCDIFETAGIRKAGDGSVMKIG
jgi:hypothetical protein